MAIEVFNRKEIKYLLDGNTYGQLLERISRYMEPDSYSRNGGYYSICNIYYDTPDDYLIRHSISKPIYKEKLRLRAYGVVGGDDKVFIEIKKKYKGIVNKRRVAMKLRDAVTYLDHKKRPCDESINPQILKELDYFCSFYDLSPKVYIAYDRRAYFGKDDNSFRVTFDTNIRTRRSDLHISDGMYGESLLEPDVWLMEVKISGGVPSWFSSVLSELKIYPTSFSKYGTEYKKFIKGEQKCLNQ